MRNLAFTFVQNDMVILELWVAYYSRYFDDLHVMCCGTKEIYEKDLKRMEAKYRLGRSHLEPNEVSPPLALPIISEHQRKFLKDHDWVLYCNCDELLIASGRKYKNLRHLMETCKKDWVHCIAYDILQVGDEKSIDYSRPYFDQRNWWLKNFSYNKIILSRIPLNWNEGCHQIAELSGELSKKFKPDGLYLLHLKYSDSKAEGRDFGPMSTAIQALDCLDQKKLIPAWAKKQLKDLYI